MEATVGFEPTNEALVEPSINQAIPILKPRRRPAAPKAPVAGTCQAPAAVRSSGAVMCTEFSGERKRVR
jgi:hypothetical protein